MKWEYLCLDPNEIQAKAKKAKPGSGSAAFNEGMNVLGSEEWELVTSCCSSDESALYCFKRELKVASPKPEIF